jgi:hypothetical protein
MPVKRSGIAMLIVLMIGGVVAVSQRAHGYIMPAEQLLNLMSARFSRFHTVLLRQSTQLMAGGEEGGGTLNFEEKVWIRSPGIYSSRITAEIEEQEVSVPEIQALRLDIDCSYRRLLVANTSNNLSSYLREWGIDQETVSLTRVDGSIAWCIGKKAKEGPRLLMDKERFLPLLLNYRIPFGQGMRTVEVQFDDYRMIEKRWFPFRIKYFLDGEMVESYIFLEAHFNVPEPAGLMENGQQ